MSTLLTDNFLSIVLNETPLLDVRAPIEFEKGAFTNATNLAILNDKQRELVGTEYKKQGNESAVKLAEELIKQEGKQQRVQVWKNYLQENPNALLYCFRGGQRSGISQSWLSEADIEITRLKGGYKAFRNYLMEESLKISKELKTIIIGGRTGSGKTLLIEELKNSIDLEKIANHRGSTFGSFASNQPSQINFENDLAYALIKFQDKGFKNLVIEHESQNIGRAFMPKPIYENLMDGELVLLETSLEKRVDVIYQDYIYNSLDGYIQKYQENGVEIWSTVISESLDKIKKRVGGKLHAELKVILGNALKQHREDENFEGYKEFIEKLLTHYYDPMYDYQLEKTKIPIIFKGNYDEILSSNLFKTS